MSRWEASALILPRMSFLWLNREDVEALLPMDECIEVVAAALRSLASGMAVQPLRSAVWMPVPSSWAPPSYGAAQKAPSPGPPLMVVVVPLAVVKTLVSFWTVPTLIPVWALPSKRFTVPTWW